MPECLIFLGKINTLLDMKGFSQFKLEFYLCALSCEVLPVTATLTKEKLHGNSVTLHKGRKRGKPSSLQASWH